MENCVAVKVAGLMLDPINGQPIVILQDIASNKIMPVSIGPAEAMAIVAELENIEPPRPMTHDLLKNMLDIIGVDAERVVINKLGDDGTYYARIYLKVPERKSSEAAARGVSVRAATAKWTAEVDARPSDAIALALRVGCPIFVLQDIFDKANEQLGSEPEEVEEFQGTEEDAREFLRGFGVDPTKGQQ